MRQSVRDAFLPFTAPLEGVVKWMYPDVKGLVSTGIGNLIDPLMLAAAVPFVKPDGSLASFSEIAEEWQRVKDFPDGARLGHLALEHVTQLRLTDEGLQSLVFGKLDQDEACLRTRFPDWDSWPADAQLGTLSMAWACGPAFRFPKLEAALKAQDFQTAAIECFMPEEATISGLRPRNRANRILYQNAAHGLHLLDPEVLYYPRDLIAEDRPTPPMSIVHPPVDLDTE